MDGEEINSVAICDGSYQYIDWTNSTHLFQDHMGYWQMWALPVLTTQDEQLFLNVVSTEAELHFTA